MKAVLGIALGLGVGICTPLTPGGPYNTSAEPEDRKINVHLVPHTHDDVGWLKTIDELYMGAKNDIQISAVQFILDSVIDSLSVNKDRKFIYVEMAFFSRWWRRQNEAKRKLVMDLLESGQLEFINGAWDSNDEATPTFLDIIDQHTMGATFIAREFGSDKNPTIGWQVDPFGHSMFQVKAYQKMGMSAWFFGRSDSQDFAVRKATRNLESVHSFVLTGSMDGYGPPSGFNWNIFSADEPLNDDEYLGEPNIEAKVEAFVKECLRRADIYNHPSEETKHIMLTMGSDFEYEYAHTWFSNMDKLIHYVNRDGRVNVFYSTPTIYTKHRSLQRTKMEVRSDYDWFPYCDDEVTQADSEGNLIKVGGHAFWTGYFTSRPLLKDLVRRASGVLEQCRVIEIIRTSPSEKLEDKDNPAWLLWEALSVVQHHDGVSGTARQLVTDDYARRLEEGMNACNHWFTPKEEPETYYPFFGASQKIENSIDGEQFNYYFAYYNSSLGNTRERPGQASGAYIFRPDCAEGNVSACRPTRLPDHVDWIRHSVMDNVISWKVGPIPQDNGLVGKEIVLIVEPQNKIKNKGVFFTDSNGYQWMRRELNKRPTWNHIVTDPVAGNYYPVVAGIAIQDEHKSMVVATDRSVGGSSLEENQIEIMIHRRTFVDDARGVGEPINEITPDGEGIVVEGGTLVRFFLTNGTVNKVPIRVPRERLRAPVRNSPLGALAMRYAPIAPGFLTITHFHRINVPEICSLGAHDCILVRVAHNDVDEGEGDVFDFDRLAHFIKVVKVAETVLHAGRTVEEAETLKIHWNGQKSENPSPLEGKRVFIRPGEIRTFIIEAQVDRPRKEELETTRDEQVVVEVI